MNSSSSRFWMKLRPPFEYLSLIACIDSSTYSKSMLSTPSILLLMIPEAEDPIVGAASVNWLRHKEPKARMADNFISK